MKQCTKSIIGVIVPATINNIIGPSPVAMSVKTTTIARIAQRDGLNLLTKCFCAA